MGHKVAKSKQMSFLLPHLESGWAVDQAILTEEERIVVIRFGHDWNAECMRQDEVLAAIAQKVSNMAAIYLVDISEVTDFNKMYDLSNDTQIMFFYRNKHIMVD